MSDSSSPTANAPMYLRMMETPLAHELAETILLLYDAKASFLAMKLWFAEHAESERERDIVGDCLFRDAIIQFVGCFDKSAEFAMSPEAVFSTVEGGVEFFGFLKNIRDSYAAHKFGTLRQCVVGVCVDSRGKVIATGHLAQHSYPIAKKSEADVLGAMSIAGRYLDAKIKRLEAALLEEANQMSPDALAHLPEARTYVGRTEEMTLTQSKFLRTRARKRS